MCLMHICKCEDVVSSMSLKGPSVQSFLNVTDQDAAGQKMTKFKETKTKSNCKSITLISDLPPGVYQNINFC